MSKNIHIFFYKIIVFIKTSTSIKILAIVYLKIYSSDNMIRNSIMIKIHELSFINVSFICFETWNDRQKFKKIPLCRLVCTTDRYWRNANLITRVYHHFSKNDTMEKSLSMMPSPVQTFSFSCQFFYEIQIIRSNITKYLCKLAFRFDMLQHRNHQCRRIR